MAVKAADEYAGQRKWRPCRVRFRTIQNLPRTRVAIETSGATGAKKAPAGVHRGWGRGVRWRISLATVRLLRSPPKCCHPVATDRISREPTRYKRIPIMLGLGYWPESRAAELAAWLSRMMAASAAFLAFGAAPIVRKVRHFGLRGTRTPRGLDEVVLVQPQPGGTRCGRGTSPWPAFRSRSWGWSPFSWTKWSRRSGAARMSGQELTAPSPLAKSISAPPPNRTTRVL